MNVMGSEQLILLTGGTGYVGGRLLSVLAGQGRRVRCLARKPSHMRRPAGDVEVVGGDVFHRESLDTAMQGVDTAYYLVHSLSGSGSFEAADVSAARNFGEAAREAGVRRIIYLGGLGNAASDLSPHLRSRQETGRVLRASGVPVIEFRASIVIGSGSLSFEIIRELVERLPVMIAPKWVSRPAQPIAVEDVLAYLTQALQLPEGHGGVYEIGGSDVVSYGDIMKEYARQRGLRRLIIPVPVLTPRLSSLWLTLVTPVHARSGRYLIDGLKNPTLVADHSALREFGEIKPMSTAQAITRALRNEDGEIAETRWSDAANQAPVGSRWGGRRLGSRIIDSRTVAVPVPPETAFSPIERIGGATGWYYAGFLWKLRGLLDQLVGGPGLRRGRRDPKCIHLGDTLDFWRVEAFEPGRRLRLKAEMKLPGRAWLEFEVTPEGTGSVIRQTAIFDPLGLAGLAYWYGIYPLHGMIFRGMLRNLAKAACVGNLDLKVPELIHSN